METLGFDCDKRQVRKQLTKEMNGNKQNGYIMENMKNEVRFRVLC